MIIFCGTSFHCFKRYHYLRFNLCQKQWFLYFYLISIIGPNERDDAFLNLTLVMKTINIKV